MTILISRHGRAAILIILTASICAGVSLISARLVTRDDFGFLLMTTWPFALTIGAFALVVRSTTFQSKAQRLLLATFAAFYLSYVWALMAFLIAGSSIDMLVPFQVLFWYNWWLGGLVALFFAVHSEHWLRPIYLPRLALKSVVIIIILAPMAFAVLVPIAFVTMGVLLSILGR